ncbi:MAG: hypothetical protein IH582_15765 [Afipia sp.]|nr:hypothetical protein [Afipia sp.]
MTVAPEIFARQDYTYIGILLLSAIIAPALSFASSEIAAATPETNLVGADGNRGGGHDQSGW